LCRGGAELCCRGGVIEVVQRQRRCRCGADVVPSDCAEVLQRFWRGGAGGCRGVAGAEVVQVQRWCLIDCAEVV
jgi:hypothetical protein